MIKAICVDDSGRPKEIPESKWLVKGEIYHVIYTVTVLPQKKLAFHLYEIDLDETCKPYEYFLSNRFGFLSEDIIKLSELIKDCCDTDFSMDELLEETKTIKNDS